MLRPVSDRSTFALLRRAPTGRAGAVRVRVAADDASPVEPAGPMVVPGAPRVAFALPRRVGGAVVRNRIRRRLRSVVAALAEPEEAGQAGAGAGLRPGGAYLVSAEAEAATCPYPILQGWVAEAVRQAHQRPPQRRPRAGAGEVRA